MRKRGCRSGSQIICPRLCRKWQNQESSPHSSASQLVISVSHGFAFTRVLNPLRYEQAFISMARMHRHLLPLSCSPRFWPLQTNARQLWSSQAQGSSLLLIPLPPASSQILIGKVCFLTSSFTQTSVQGGFLTPLITIAAPALFTFSLLVPVALTTFKSMCELCEGRGQGFLSSSWSDTWTSAWYQIDPQYLSNEWRLKIQAYQSSLSLSPEAN